VLNPAETNILNQALLALKKEAGLDLASGKTSTITHPKDNHADFTIETLNHTLNIEVKRNLRPAQYCQNVKRSGYSISGRLRQQLPEPAPIICPYKWPKARNRHQA